VCLLRCVPCVRVCVCARPPCVYFTLEERKLQREMQVMSAGDILWPRLHTFYYYHYNVPIIATHCACVCNAPLRALLTFPGPTYVAADGKIFCETREMDRLGNHYKRLKLRSAVRVVYNHEVVYFLLFSMWLNV
jgi:hypothetical protein